MIDFNFYFYILLVSIFNWIGCVWMIAIAFPLESGLYFFTTGL